MLLNHLENVQQEKNETLKFYLEHFNKKLSTIAYALEKLVRKLVVGGFRPHIKISKELQDEECTSLACFYKMSKTHLQMESSIAAWKNTDSKALTRTPPKNKNASKGKRKDNEGRQKAFKKLMERGTQKRIPFC